MLVSTVLYTRYATLLADLLPYASLRFPCLFVLQLAQLRSARSEKYDGMEVRACERGYSCIRLSASRTTPTKQRSQGILNLDLLKFIDLTMLSHPVLPGPCMLCFYPVVCICVCTRRCADVLMSERLECLCLTEVHLCRVLNGQKTVLCSPCPA